MHLFIPIGSICRFPGVYFLIIAGIQNALKEFIRMLLFYGELLWIDRFFDGFCYLDLDRCLSAARDATSPPRLSLVLSDCQEAGDYPEQQLLQLKQ
jgi:hypothetical protein